MNLFSLFKQAQQNLQRPKLVFPVDETKQINVAICSKHEMPDFPNYLYLYLVENKQFPGTYLGKITKKNELVLAPAVFLQKDLRDTCKRLFLEPHKLCQIQGRRHSFCCFCGTEITSKDSLAVGYGPICADKWGLPWGEETKLQSQLGQAIHNEQQQHANSHETNHN